MKRIIKPKVNNVDHEKNFKNKFHNEEIYIFLEVNKIGYDEASKYFLEFMMFEDNPKKYILLYEYESIVLQEKKTWINEGIYYLDQEYFKEQKDLSNVDYASNNSKAMIVKHYVENPKGGLFICGPNGIGKTTLVSSLANDYYTKHDIKTLFVFWPDFIEKTKRFDNNNINYIQKVKRAKRLIIDDLGQESITQWSRDDILHSIISFRIEKNLTTYITSNYTLEELLDLYTLKTVESKKSKSIISKINGLCKNFNIYGENLRSRD